MSTKEQQVAGTKVQVGDKAPDFTLPTATGTNVSLHDFLGQKAVVVYFYPKDNTGGCTAEACAFRDSYEVFKQAGAEVIGISSDSEESHEQFATKNRLPFILLSDRGGEVRKLFGVAPAIFGLLPGRATYVIDKQGIVRHSFSSMAPGKHMAEALQTVQALERV